MTYQLHLGDCIEGMRAMADKSLAAVIADPEYSEWVHANFGKETRSDGSAERGEIGFDCLTQESANLYAEQYCRLCTGWIVLFCDEMAIHMWRFAIEASGGQYVRAGTWVKTNPMPQMSGDRPASGTECIVIAHSPRRSGRMIWNGGGKAATYTFPIVQGPARVHPTQKPDGLMDSLVTDFTNPGDLVLDSHAGSGSTAAACIRLGRRFIGFEKDPKHHATATARLARCVVDLGAVQRQGLLALPKPKQLTLCSDLDLP